MKVLVGFTINLIGECPFRSRSIPRPTDLRFLQTTLSFLKVPPHNQISVPKHSAEHRLIKGDAFEFCESTVTTNLRSR